jgi:6-pyruvoyl-tetrahydropterin synthase
MKYRSVAVARFEAAHRVEGHSRCGDTHGHQWIVSVAVEGGLDPKKVYVVDHGSWQEALAAVVNELHDRDLNDMLPGVVTTPEGLALYIRERLILDWPRIVSVAVDMGGWAQAIAEGDIR